MFDVLLDLHRWLRGYRAEWQAVASSPAPLGSIEQLSALQAVVVLDRVQAEVSNRMLQALAQERAHESVGR